MGFLTSETYVAAKSDGRLSSRLRSEFRTLTPALPMSSGLFRLPNLEELTALKGGGSSSPGSLEGWSSSGKESVSREAGVSAKSTGCMPESTLSSAWLMGGEMSSAATVRMMTLGV